FTKIKDFTLADAGGEKVAAFHFQGQDVRKDRASGMGLFTPEGQELGHVTDEDNLKDLQARKEGTQFARRTEILPSAPGLLITANPDVAGRRGAKLLLLSAVAAVRVGGIATMFRAK